MADTRDNESGVTIEGEWEANNEQDQTEPDHGDFDAPRGGKFKKLAGLLLVLALVGGMGYGGYLGWQYVEQYIAQQADSDAQNTRLLEQINALESRVDDLNRTMAVDGLEQGQRADKLQSQLNEITGNSQLNNDQIVALQSQLADWATRFGTGDKPQHNRWQLAEAEWLLWLANMRLQLQQQYAGAITALSHADELLQQVNHPQMRQVRALIAEEVVTLKTTERPDVDSIALVLLALSNQAAELPLPARPRPAGEIQQVSDSPQASNTDKTWQQIINGVWQEVRGLVVIRRQEKNLRPWLSENEEQLIYQGLQVRLDASRLAALRGQNNLFQQSVRSAQTWLLTWFDGSTAAVQAVDEELNSLAQQKITLVQPDISGSLTALRELRQQQGQQ